MQTPRSLHLWRVSCRSRGDHPQADRERGADPPTQIWKLVSQGGHLCCMCIILTDIQTDKLSVDCSYTDRTTHRYRVWHETFSSYRDRQTDRQTVMRLSVPTQTDRVAVLPLHTDIGSGTRLSPLTETDRQTDCHEPVPSQTRQATCPPTQEDVGLAQDFLLLQRQTVRDFSTLLPWLQWQTLEWLLERLPFTSTVIDQKIGDCVSY